MSIATVPVSVGLPVFNGEAYLEFAIESLLNQDFADLEVVIADNASTDATEEICRAAMRADPRVAYHRSDVNRGAAWNFSRLLDLTSGRYFRWASHDDGCDPTYVRRCVEVLEERPDVSLCFTRSLRIDENGQSLGVETIKTPATARRAGARARSFLMQRYFPKAAPFGLLRRADAERTGLIRPYKSSDRIFLLELSMLGRFHQIGDALYLHRTHPDRSVFLPQERRMAWWDGGPDGRRHLPRWRLLRGYAETAAAAPAPLWTRAEVLCSLAPWMVQNAGPLLREVHQAFRGSPDSLPVATETTS